MPAASPPTRHIAFPCCTPRRSHRPARSAQPLFACNPPLLLPSPSHSLFPSDHTPCPSQRQHAALPRSTDRWFLADHSECGHRPVGGRWRRTRTRGKSARGRRDDRGRRKAATGSQRLASTVNTFLTNDDTARPYCRPTRPPGCVWRLTPPKVSWRVTSRLARVRPALPRKKNKIKEHRPCSGLRARRRSSRGMRLPQQRDSFLAPYTRASLERTEPWRVAHSAAQRKNPYKTPRLARILG